MIGLFYRLLVVQTKILTRLTKWCWWQLHTNQGQPRLDSVLSREQCSCNNVERFPFFKVSREPMRGKLSAQNNCFSSADAVNLNTREKYFDSKPFDWHRNQHSKTEHQGFPKSVIILQKMPFLKDTTETSGSMLAGDSDTRSVFFWPLPQHSVCVTPTDQVTSLQSLFLSQVDSHFQLSLQLLEPTLSSRV